MEKLRIVFMGTPEFAVGILDEILKHGYDVASVITAADKPAGRGQKIKYSAVKEYALEKGLNILQPTNLKDPEFLSELSALNANLQIVVAFRMLPEVVWKMPKYGTFNLHASLLPEYRGAAPINWAIINGEKTTGVTTFFIDDKIDTGAIILKKQTDILPDENAGSLHDRLMLLGASAVIETLEQIENDRVNVVLQPNSTDLKTAYKLNRENCRIDWNRPALEIFNLIRGLSPYPSAWCWLNNDGNEINIKIYESSLSEEETRLAPGTIRIEKKSLAVATADKYLMIHSLQMPGKKKMEISELLNGMSFSDGSMMS